MKHVFFGKSSTPCKVVLGKKRIGGFIPLTARSYVQDGLIAMWDGIENAGWGTHVAAATTWKDLSGNGYDLTLMNGAHFDANSLITAGRNSVSALLSTTLPYATIEVCAFYDSSRSSSRLVCFGNSIDSSRLLKCAPNGIQYYNGNYVITVSESKSMRTWAATYSDAATPYIDGQLATGTVSTNRWDYRTGTFGLSGSNNYSSWNFVGNYYCVRLYSRALTADEIAANYAVDKARFNLQ